MRLWPKAIFYPILHHNCLSPSLSKSLLNICILIDNRILAYLHFRSISFHFNFQEDEPRLLGIFLDFCYSLIDVTLFLSSRNILSRAKRRDVYSQDDEPSSRAVAIH